MLMIVLALCWLAAGIVGAVQSHLGLIAFGFGLFAVFGLFGWWLSPFHIQSRRYSYRTTYRIQNAFFRRVGMRWAVGPEDDDQRSSSEGDNGPTH